MKKTKIGIGIAFFVALIIISSSTIAIPISQKKAVEIIGENQGIINQKEVIDQYLGTEPLNTNVDLIDFLWDLFKDDEFIEEFLQAGIDIIDEIENKFPNGKEMIEDFFHVKETFDTNTLRQRIKNAEGENILNYVQELLEVPDTYDELNDTGSEETGEFLEFLYTAGMEDASGLHPLIEIIAYIIRSIAHIYAIPLSLLPGGLFLANYITIILFGPIIAYLVLIEGCADAYEQEEELREELDDIKRVLGIYGLIVIGPPAMLIYAINGGYLGQAFEEVLEIIIITEIWSSDNYKTGETAPTALSIFGKSSAKVNTNVDFSAKVVDRDKISDNGIKMYRDYIQVGWDWNGDKEVDEWTKLNNNYGENTLIKTSHKFTKKGKYVVRYLPRDNWGATGEWSNKIEVDVTNGKSKILPFSSILEKLSLINNFIQRFLGQKNINVINQP